MYCYYPYNFVKLNLMCLTAISQASLNKADEEQESSSSQLHDHNSAPFDDDAEFFGDGK